MKDNYRAWDINISGFYEEKTDSDRLRFLLKFAVLAPSSHNSQPWKFSAHDNEIILEPDLSRALPASDVNNRQLYISLGCALENLLVAADYYGLVPEVSLGSKATKISFRPSDKEPVQDRNHLILAIPQRHTNRNPYRSKMPDPRFMSWAKGLASDDLRIDCITEQAAKNQIADIVIAAGIDAMEDKGFRKELSQYVKSNITKSKIGMPAFGMGIPTPISLIAPLLLKFINMNKLTRKQDEKLLKEHTPVFALISAREDNPESWMRAGQIYERIALEAERQGLNTAPMAAAIQIGEHYKELQQILQTSFRPQIFFRLGYGAKITPHSPRLLAEDVAQRG